MLAVLALCPHVHAALLSAASLSYGISGRQTNQFEFDFTAAPDWTAGSQRSANGTADGGNDRSGRVFAEFQLDAATVAAASGPGAFAQLTFTLDGVGAGVAGTPYTDGLDLSFYGVASASRDAQTYFNTSPTGADQADIAPVTASAGTYTITLTNTAVLAQIASAAPGDYLGFGFGNTAGTINGEPVGNSFAETYGFQMDHAQANYAFNVVPEPASAAFLALGLAAALALRRRATRA